MVPADALRWSLVSTRLGWWVSLPMLLALGGNYLLALSDEYEGKPIANVQFEPERQPLSRDQLMAMIPLRPGQPLTGSDVRATIERLYRTGEYLDIAIDATIGPSGVILKVMTKPNYFVGHVAVTGVPEPPNAGQLVLATKLEVEQSTQSTSCKPLKTAWRTLSNATVSTTRTFKPTPPPTPRSKK